MPLPGRRSPSTIDRVEFAKGSDYVADVPVRIKVDPSPRFEPPRLLGAQQFPSADTAMPTANEFPSLSVQELRDVVVAPRHVILDADCTKVLAPTFKKHRTHRHFGVRHLGGDAYSLRTPFASSSVRSLDGPVYYLDCEFEDIYGHNLIEVFPQLWALPLLQLDDVKFVTSIRLRPYVLQALAALGVREDRIVQLDAPLRCERLLVPTPAIKARRYVHPICTTIFDKLGTLRFAGQDASAAIDQVGPLIYLSRSRVDERRLTNEGDIERIASGLGFSIVHPQEHSLEAQLRMYSRATHLIGPGGSAMHNAVFTPMGTRVLILASRSWFTVIDVLLSQRRYDLSYVFGDPTDPALRERRGQGEWQLPTATFERCLEDFVTG